MSMTQRGEQRQPCQAPGPTTIAGPPHSAGQATTGLSGTRKKAAAASVGARRRGRAPSRRAQGCGLQCLAHAADAGCPIHAPSPAASSIGSSPSSCWLEASARKPPNAPASACRNASLRAVKEHKSVSNVRILASLNESRNVSYVRMSCTGSKKQ